MDVLHLLCAVRKPSIVTYHADIVRAPHLFFLYKPLLHRFLGRVDRVVATSDALMQTSPVLRRVKEKTVVIPLGIAEETYPVPTAKEVSEVRAAYGDGFFLFVGVLRYYKGLDYLMEAVRGQPFRIVVVGDGPERERLERKASRLNLENVAFAGRVNDSQKMAFLRLCRAVVCPSHLPAEAYGLSLVEGAMMSKPLVCCNLGTGTTFVNRHMETGVVVPPADPKELREALRILHNDPALAERLGAGARSHFVANLRAETMGRRYSQLYRDLLL
jgi:rhamnosyl/mannosyltransferase